MVPKPVALVSADRTCRQVFPPKTDIGTSNLIDRLERMTVLDPAWVHVTWGAGGSTHETSLDLAGAAQGMGIDTCLHLTCTNMLKDVLDGALEVSVLWERTRVGVALSWGCQTAKSFPFLRTESQGEGSSQSSRIEGR